MLPGKPGSGKTEKTGKTLKTGKSPSLFLSYVSNHPCCSCFLTYNSIIVEIPVKTRNAQEYLGIKTEKTENR